MKIGICGGTFDPFHRGHLDPVLAVREELQWDRVLYIPAYIQPFKQDRESASPYHRFAMVALSTIAHEQLVASPMELERGSVSYTVDTLTSLRERYPHARLDWIIGDDNLEQLHEWKSIETIVQLANFIVLTRQHATSFSTSIAGLKASVRPAHHGSIVFAENATVPVSSTEVRMRVRNGEPIDDLVPPPVSRYIHHYELYRKGQS
ncbi:MAG TPA: nicotinate (nicotinamide) nucleotide adenylyltransferase [Thermoanaerobaculia bacterium]|nr:nicotinate (nicotinamide) nucleotide adenylyltransferase [Thermoanaerobaculia bacterium]